MHLAEAVLLLAAKRAKPGYENMPDKTASAKPSQEPRSIWNNDLPAGDSPPRSRATLIAAAVAYGCWLVFLAIMTILRITYTA